MLTVLGLADQRRSPSMRHNAGIAQPRMAARRGALALAALRGRWCATKCRFGSKQGARCCSGRWVICAAGRRHGGACSSPTNQSREQRSREGPYRPAVPAMCSSKPTGRPHCVGGYHRRTGSSVSRTTSWRSSPLTTSTTPAVVEARVVAMRKAHPGWRPRTIGNHLERGGGVPGASRSAIYRALLRHNLVDQKARRKRRRDYTRWERARAMELRPMDILGGVRLTDGSGLPV